jgi:hypothetical protein
MEDKPENTRVQKPEGTEERSLTDLYLAGTATGAGLATGKIFVDTAAEKIKGALQPKDDGSKVVLPPGSGTDK